MPSSRVLSNAKLIAVCTLLSRVTGLARDVLLAQAFGLSWIQDAFSYAFQLPNLFRRLFGEGAMSSVFVPTFSRVLEHDGRDAAWRLLARTIALMTVAIGAVLTLVALLIVLAWQFSPASVEKADARKLLLALTLIMLPYMLSICLLALLSSVLNCLDHFVIAAMAPVALNLVMIVAIAVAAPALHPGDPHMQVYTVAAGVLVAGAVQLLWLAPALRAAGVRLGWSWAPRDPTVRRMLALLGPVALGQGVLIFGVFLDAQICTLLTHVDGAPTIADWFGLCFEYPLTEGALSAVTYAQRLYQFPLGVLVISLATAALPAFSRSAARADWVDWAAQVRQALRLAVFEGLLAGTMMTALAAPITRLLFQYGAFTSEHTARTAAVLSWYGLAMWAFCAQHIVTRAFYSLSDVRTPLWISAAVLPLNVGLSFGLLWIAAIREQAFAISSVLTSAISVVAGMYVLRRRKMGVFVDASLVSAVLRMAVCAAAASAALLWAAPHVSEWLGPWRDGLPGRAIETFGLLGAGTLLFFAIAWILRLSEPRLLLARSGR